MTPRGRILHQIVPPTSFLTREPVYAYFATTIQHYTVQYTGYLAYSSVARQPHKFFYPFIEHTAFVVWCSWKDFEGSDRVELLLFESKNKVFSRTSSKTLTVKKKETEKSRKNEVCFPLPTLVKMPDQQNVPKKYKKSQKRISSERLDCSSFLRRCINRIP